MKSRHLFLVSLVLAAAMMLAACAQAQPAPTQAPAAPAQPTKAAEPAKPVSPTAQPAAPTAQPAAPATKAAWPAAGKSITYIVPYTTGGSVDIMGRLLSAGLEKELGVPVQVVNKAGANTQIGVTDLANAKPDGYTIGAIDFPAINTSYMLPDRGATYGPKNFSPLWMLYESPPVWYVNADSPFKTVKDVIDASKAKPGSVKMGDNSLMGPLHLVNLAIGKATGITYTGVHFDGASPQMTALLGGHIDIGCTALPSAAANYKGGKLRLLGIGSKERDPLAPEVPTFREQGVDVVLPSRFLVAVPAGVSKDITDTLISTIKKITSSADFQQKAQNSLIALSPVMTPAELQAAWAEMDTAIKPLVELAAKEDTK
jgi:tripartite-type tricarboxylate transporter receptor subunit TctC